MLTLGRRYLAHRRKLGFALRIEGMQVLQFARFADRVAAGQPLTAALALRWATLPRTENSQFYHAKRLESLRGFARFCAIFDPRVEVPGAHMIGPAHRRRSPHIYSAAQIRLILRRAAALPCLAGDPLRAITFATLIGLIACTGLRMGEALRLKETDFDPEAGTLHVPRAKFSPERVLPLQPSTVRALRRYQTARRRHPLCTDRFFVGRTGHPLNQQTVYYTFRGLTRDFVTNGARRRPRFHDFRHTLATKLIAKWSQEQAPGAHHLLLLCRYLGHRSFRDTFWYVSADPAALASVAERFKRFWHARTESAHEPNPVPLAHSEILRRPLDRSAECQSANRRRISRYLPSAAAVSLRPPRASG
jgi:integrase